MLTQKISSESLTTNGWNNSLPNCAVIGKWPQSDWKDLQKSWKTVWIPAPKQRSMPP